MVLARFAASVLFGLVWQLSGPRPALVLFAVLLAGVVPVAVRLLRGADHPATPASAGASE